MFEKIISASWVLFGDKEFMIILIIRNSITSWKVTTLVPENQKMYLENLRKPELGSLNQKAVTVE